MRDVQLLGQHGHRAALRDVCLDVHARYSHLLASIVKQPLVPHLLAVAKTAAVEHQEVLDTRRAKLGELVGSYPSMQAFADTIERDHAYVWQLVNGKRPIGE